MKTAFLVIVLVVFSKICITLLTAEGAPFLSFSSNHTFLRDKTEFRSILFLSSVWLMFLFGTDILFSCCQVKLDVFS